MHGFFYAEGKFMPLTGFHEIEADLVLKYFNKINIGASTVDKALNLLNKSRFLDLKYAQERVGWKRARYLRIKALLRAYDVSKENSKIPYQDNDFFFFVQLTVILDLATLSRKEERRTCYANEATLILQRYKSLYAFSAVASEFPEATTSTLGAAGIDNILFGIVRQFLNSKGTSSISYGGLNLVGSSSHLVHILIYMFRNESPRFFRFWKDRYETIAQLVIENLNTEEVHEFQKLLTVISDMRTRIRYVFVELFQVLMLQLETQSFMNESEPVAFRNQWSMGAHSFWNFCRMYLGSSAKTRLTLSVLQHLRTFDARIFALTEFWLVMKTLFRQPTACPNFEAIMELLLVDIEKSEVVNAYYGFDNILSLPAATRRRVGERLIQLRNYMKDRAKLGYYDREESEKYLEKIGYMLSMIVDSHNSLFYLAELHNWRLVLSEKKSGSPVPRVEGIGPSLQHQQKYSDALASAFHTSDQIRLFCNSHALAQGAMPRYYLDVDGGFSVIVSQPMGLHGYVGELIATLKTSVKDLLRSKEPQADLTLLSPLKDFVEEYKKSKAAILNNEFDDFLNSEENYLRQFTNASFNDILADINKAEAKLNVGNIAFCMPKNTAYLIMHRIQVRPGNEVQIERKIERIDGNFINTLEAIHALSNEEFTVKQPSSSGLDNLNNIAEDTQMKIRNRKFLQLIDTLESQIRFSTIFDFFGGMNDELDVENFKLYLSRIGLLARIPWSFLFYRNYRSVSVAYILSISHFLSSVKGSKTKGNLDATQHRRIKNLVIGVSWDDTKLEAGESFLPTINSLANDVRKISKTRNTRALIFRRYRHATSRLGKIIKKHFSTFTGDLYLFSHGFYFPEDPFNSMMVLNCYKSGSPPKRVLKGLDVKAILKMGKLGGLETVYSSLCNSGASSESVDLTAGLITGFWHSGAKALFGFNTVAYQHMVSRIHEIRVDLTENDHLDSFGATMRYLSNCGIPEILWYGYSQWEFKYQWENSDKSSLGAVQEPPISL